MKICIIVPSSLSYVPFLRCYEEALEETTHHIHILYWDRYGIEESKPGTTRFARVDLAKGIALLPGYLKYRSFLMRHFRHNEYDLYLVLTSQMGVLLWDYLYGRRFILDIRDFSHEQFWPYRLLLTTLLNRANLVCYSSASFLNWLPPLRRSVLSHNCTLSHLSKIKHDQGGFNFKTRIISYIGAVGYLEANIGFLQLVQDMPGIEIRYIGKGSSGKDLAEYSRIHGLKNVKFLGKYLPDEKERFYTDTNFVLGCYGINRITRHAIPNRLYESCIFKRPIIVNAGTYLADVVRQNGLGIVIVREDPHWLMEQIDRYYDRNVFRQFELHCEEFLAKVKFDISRFHEELKLSLTCH